MKDREFLFWIHARLTDVHGEDPLIDYMHKLRAVALSTPKDQKTPNVLMCNNLEDAHFISNMTKG